MSSYIKLSEIVQTGDWIFVASDSEFARIIRKITFSKVNHVVIAYDATRILETDLQYGKAVMHLTSSLDGKRVVVVRPKFYYPQDYLYIRGLCRAYEGMPYSVWDVIANGLFFWLKSEIRAKVIKLLSNKTFMKCDELVARITWEVTRHKTLGDWEGLTPGRLLEIAYSNPVDYKIVLSTL